MNESREKLFFRIIFGELKCRARRLELIGFPCENSLDSTLLYLVIDNVNSRLCAEAEMSKSESHSCCRDVWVMKRELWGGEQNVGEPQAAKGSLNSRLFRPNKRTRLGVYRETISVSSARVSGKKSRDVSWNYFLSAISKAKIYFYFSNISSHNSCETSFAERRKWMINFCRTHSELLLLFPL